MKIILPNVSNPAQRSRDVSSCGRRGYCRGPNSTAQSIRDVSDMFGRPFMGGMERKGVLATGNSEEVQKAATEVLSQAPERFILAADCTVPSDTLWENLRTAIETAHGYRKH